jgi:hypothetical protein
MPHKPMKKKYRKAKAMRISRRKSGLGRFVVVASLIALGIQVRAGDAITPEQLYEGGTNSYNNWIELSTGALLTRGNANQAKQGEQHDTGIFGGIEDLHYETQVAKKTTFTLDGRSIFDDHDYSVGLGLVRDDYGFLRLNFENFRTWDSGTGGYLPDAQLSYALPGDALALDRGKISFEAGLTKPNLPQITFKYTHSYRNGDESSTLWGPIHDNGSIYRPYPGIYSLDEKSDTFQLDLTHHYKKINYGVGLSYELGSLNDAHKLTFFQGEPVQQEVTDQQGTSYDMLSTHAFAESWLKKNLFLSTGFMFANIDDTFTGSRIYGDDFDVVYSPAYPALSYGYFNLNGGAHEHEYVWNVNLMSLPTRNWSIVPSLRVQKEDWNASSAGTGTFYDPSSSSSYQNDFAGNSGRDSIDVCERLDFRYTGMTNWVLNFGGQWTEGQGNLNEHGGFTQVTNSASIFGPTPVQFATDDSRLFQKYFASLRWYPVYRASLDVGGYYKINQYNYNNTLDNTPNDLSTGNAYPGFILYQGFETWDGNIRLTFRPLSKVTLVSRYEYQYSTIRTRPDPASTLDEVDSSKMQTHIIGQNVSWTPLDWLGLQAGFNYVLSTTKTPASDYTQAVLDSQNNYWTVNFNSDFVLDEKTDLNLGYFYYRAADGQNQIVGGLPLGTDTEEHSLTATLVRRITQNLRLNLKYAFTHYEDLASGGNFNYDAHVIFASLQYRF